MKVVVDASAAFNQGAGIGRYARQLAPAMARALPEARITLVYAPEAAGPARFAVATMSAFATTPTVRRLPFSRRRGDQLWFRARLPLPIQLFVGPTDVVYSPDFTVPPSGRAPRVMTIHDLAYLIYPEFAPPPLTAYLQAVVPRQLAAAARVLTVSETSKRALIERLGVAADRIVVIPNGVDERFFAASPLPLPARVRLGLPESYLLAVGTIEPRKNLTTLFEALSLAGSRLDLPLVVAGRDGWHADAIRRAGAPLQRAGRLIFLDYVDEHDLPGLYAGAAALVYPSWYEGFGLPVLEALATGIPVVTSTAPAPVEVAGDHAWFADPGSKEELAAAIATALSPVQRSPERMAAGRAHARRYDWSNSGAKLATVLRTVVAERRGARGEGRGARGE